MNNNLAVRQLGDATIIEFYPSVYNQKSKVIVERGKKFREIVRPGAFDNADMTNVKATVFHDKNKIIGRSSSGTLELVSDEYGLKAIVRMGTTTLHKDTIEQIERGDLFESSFIARMDKFNEVYEGGELIRYIDSFSLVRDVSIVDDGAYSNTDIIIRELPKNFKMDEKLKELEIQNKEPKQSLKEAESKVEELKRSIDDDSENKELKKHLENKENAVEELKRNLEVKEEEVEELKRNIEKFKNSNTMHYIEEIKRALNGGEKATIVIVRNASKEGAVIGLNGNITKEVSSLDIMGKEPVWKKLGVDYLPNCQGTFTLPFDVPLTAEELKEIAAVTPVDFDLQGNLVSAKRFSIQRKFSVETLANANPENIDALLADMYKGVDRKLSEKVFAIAEAGATEIKEVTAVGEDSFDSLSGTIDTENEISFLMARSLFYSNKNAKLDAGSGLHVMKKEGEFGKTWEGDNVFFSTLFPTANKVVAGDMKKILVADYNKTEVIVDPYTLAGKGQVIITVIGLYGVALRNPNAFTKSAAID